MNMNTGKKYYRRTTVDDFNEEYGKYVYKTKKGYKTHHDDWKFNQGKDHWESWGNAEANDDSENLKDYKKDDPRHPESKEFKDFEEKPFKLHHWSKIKLRNNVRFAALKFWYYLLLRLDGGSHALGSHDLGLHDPKLEWHALGWLRPRCTI